VASESVEVARKGAPAEDSSSFVLVEVVVGRSSVTTLVLVLVLVTGGGLLVLVVVITTMTVDGEPLTKVVDVVVRVLTAGELESPLGLGTPSLGR